MSGKAENPIPVILLTGFLGSGKTTLLQRILNRPQLPNTAVIINEFGEVGIDHHLVRQVAENVVLLPNGCLCCKVRDDLGVTMRELYRASRSGDAGPLERLIIETTGLADPVPIVHTLMTDPVVDEAFQLQSIVTVVDAVNGERNLSAHGESVKQVAVADHLIITKTDIADEEWVSVLISQLRRINPAAAIEIGQASSFDLGSLFSGGDRLLADDPSQLASWINEDAYAGARDGHHHHHDDAEDIVATCMVLDGTLDWTAFTIWLTMLLHSRGSDVLRIKGLLNIEGHPGPVVFQGVQHVVSPPLHMPAWPDGDRSSRLVFITRGIEPAVLKRSLMTFDAAARIMQEEMPVTAQTMRHGVGTEVEGRPYRRAGGLAWMR